MEDDSLIDLSNPLIIIQIVDERHLMLSTNMEHEDVQIILEEVLENMMEQDYDASIAAHNIIKRLQ